MKYEVFPPFALPRQNHGLFTRDAGERADFWDELDGFCPGLPGACGCYVISVRNVVWYVGVAEKQSFRHECFSPHKVGKIDEAISIGRGNAMLHLLAKITPQGRFTRPGVNGHKDADFLEKMLIGIGLDRNQDLLNKSDTALLREIKVPGFLNSPKWAARTVGARSLRQVMGM
jgi:hypothetical protein